MSPNPASERVDGNKSVPAASQGAVYPNPVATRLQELFEYGKNRAIGGQALSPRDADLAALEAHARAITRALKCDAYDPSRFAADRLREREYEKLISDRAAAEDAKKFADARLRIAEGKLSTVNPDELPPALPLAIMVCSVVVIAISVAPTLHDFVFHTLEDDLLNWAVSLTSGLLVGVLLTWTILGAGDASETGLVRRRSGVGAGIWLASVWLFCVFPEAKTRANMSSLPV